MIYSDYQNTILLFWRDYLRLRFHKAFYFILLYNMIFYVHKKNTTRNKKKLRNITRKQELWKTVFCL